MRTRSKPHIIPGLNSLPLRRRKRHTPYQCDAHPSLPQKRPQPLEQSCSPDSCKHWIEMCSEPHNANHWDLRAPANLEPTNHRNSRKLFKSYLLRHVIVPFPLVCVVWLPPVRLPFHFNVILYFLPGCGRVRIFKRVLLLHLWRRPCALHNYSQMNELQCTWPN